MITAKTEKGDLWPRVSSKKLETTETETTATLEVTGKASYLQTARAGPLTETGVVSPRTWNYSVGQSVTVFGVSLPITRSVLESGDGGLGKLTVTATKEQRTETGETDPVSGQPVTAPTFYEELEWQLQNKALSEFAGTSPMDFSTLFSTPASDEYQGLKRWLDMREETKYVARTAAFYTPTAAAAKKDSGANPAVDGDWVTLASLSATAQKYAEKIAKGTEEFMVQVPVYRRTSTTSNIGQTSGVGTRSAPPSGSKIPSGYVWLKTADNYHRDTKHGRWTHSEEWTGFASLDSDLYP